MNIQKYPHFFVLTICALGLAAAAPLSQTDDPNPPDEVVKLIFIHHSTGENWLTDGYGDLGRELGRNNYFVSDTNYGWGPDYIGDRTDIPNWMEWFRSSATPTYMQTLFNESGQNSSYTRTLSNPGGENRIIMFKSCFPNSALEGNPNDPPGTYEELTVAGAKYVYNQILQYFATRPDKLFVVITAPPLSDPSNARNARAFNNWLVNDWLRENNYALNNVAVFDFYNVLTDRDAHHRYEDGRIGHIIGGQDTLDYPTGDDHPSEKGSRKATEEFIPLLNIFYHRWITNSPQQPPAESAALSPAEQVQEPAAPQPQEVAGQPISAGLLDGFEAGVPAGTGGWEAFMDGATSTSMSCSATTDTSYGGISSLLLDFDIAPGGWSTCALFYDSLQDWSGAEGLTFYLLAGQAGLVFDVDIYAGSDEARETYLYTIEAPADSVSNWIPFSLYWADFHRADWEDGAGTLFGKPDQIAGLAFGMGTYPDTPNTGQLWVDDLSLLGGVTQAAEELPVQEQEPSGEEEEPVRERRLPCGISFALSAALILAGASKRRKNTENS